MTGIWGWRIGARLLGVVLFATQAQAQTARPCM